MENKNRNVTEQLEHCNVDKNDNNKEMEKLVEDMEVLKDKVSKMKPQDSVSTQTEPTKAQDQQTLVLLTEQKKI